ncbi:pentatricopeptide repeat-containing protein At3g49710-like [Zingiber officinale]|uniref:pentatricopeptide repeat-containing protein At3g49710-like n=1 Tax=Zingiber officinale TaxID=94328 RepID=UPI001C4D56F8|nr:pentatricopeptide repeat-containing protein At3g49710-like [Zingiber officinale]
MPVRAVEKKLSTPVKARSRRRGKKKEEDVAAGGSLSSATKCSNANGFTLSSIISYVINVIEQFHSLTIALGLDSYVSINNALISSYNKGYLLNDEFSEEGLECFCDTQRARVKSDNCIFLYTSIACLNFPSPSQGKQMHGKTIKIESPRNQIPVDNALVSMYVKCGNLKDANMLFEMMHQCNMVSFNTMITPYAHHGFGLEELELFKVILDIENEPTSIIFILVLSTRSHTGKVDEGWKYFDSMRQKYDIELKEEHYSCMIYLLAYNVKFKKRAETIIIPILQ